MRQSRVAAEEEERRRQEEWERTRQLAVRRRAELLEISRKVASALVAADRRHNLHIVRSVRRERQRLLRTEHVWVDEPVVSGWMVLTRKHVFRDTDRWPIREELSLDGTLLDPAGGLHRFRLRDCATLTDEPPTYQARFDGEWTEDALSGPLSTLDYLRDFETLVGGLVDLANEHRLDLATLR
ncbi:hypothetical protein AB0H57_02250 [Micromonospora sp. NPDC050686]|uniref:hypothetical protein n=1 Tax=Micromonospora sp. NPDC050686 TaxID=3154631 RepID=UPI0034105B52